jgi:hypothetical protein
MRMLVNEVHPLGNTFEAINIDRVDMTPLIEAYSDVVPKEHLVGKASLPLCCKTVFTSIMSGPSIGIDRGMKLVASSD